MRELRGQSCDCSEFLCVALDCAAFTMAEEARLRQNIEDQLERLLSQLADRDELKAELSDEEYQSEK